MTFFMQPAKQGIYVLLKCRLLASQRLLREPVREQLANIAVIMCVSGEDEGFILEAREVFGVFWELDLAAWLEAIDLSPLNRVGIG
jgi:hypothetical protein